MSADGKFFFSVEMYYNSIDRSLQNLSCLDQQQTCRKLLAQIPTDSSWMLVLVGKLKARLTDTDCCYCRKLHQKVRNINYLGIFVRYLTLLQAGIGSDSYARIASVWCAGDRNAAITAAKLRVQNGEQLESLTWNVITRWQSIVSWVR
jgi:thiol:disulfide interchange protein DsbC